VTSSAKAAIGSLPLGFPPLSVEDLNALLSRLPAAERAALAWAPKAVEDALRRLREEPLDADLIAKCTMAVFESCGKALAPVLRLLGDQQLLAEISGLYRAEVERLLPFLPDAGSRRSAQWSMRAYMAFLNVLANDPEVRTAATTPEALPQWALTEAFQDDAGGLVRAIVLLMAAMSIAERKGDRERAAELADTAYLEASRGVDRLVQMGAPLAMDGEDSPATRGQRILACVQEAREKLTPEDVAVLAKARLRELR
jgi:hypothetical protein